IAVNKIPNIRGALVRSAGDAESGVRHNNANVITIGADTTNFLKAKKIIKTFLNSEFEGGRHSRRVEIIKRIESGK
ncbi:MAG: RpiB/LacA/LacB family sugar-phosphate isomerase, partial [Elusimicrobiota bacterium]